MNKYQNAGGSEPPYYQIICPVCKIKDITQDKSTWVCPNCKENEIVAIQKVITGVATKKVILSGMPGVVAGVAKAIEKQAPGFGIVKKESDLPPNEDISNFFKSIGVEPPKTPEPAQVKESKIGGFTVKTITTGRK